MYDTLNNLLMTEGTVIISQDDLPVHRSEWLKLNQLFNESEYENITQGDTKEITFLKVFRVKKAGLSDIHDDRIMNIIDSSVLRNLLTKITKMDKYVIDRCQCHIYTKGNFVSKHIDADSCKNYKFAFMMLLDDDYQGGEFCVHRSDGSIRTYKPLKYSLILTRCDFAHEVKEITSGKRRTVVAFMKHS